MPLATVLPLRAIPLGHRSIRQLYGAVAIRFATIWVLSMDSSLLGNTLMADLVIPTVKWVELQAELRRRGSGVRESGAFLLGDPRSGCVSECLYYDDLDPNSLDQGFIFFSTAGYLPLWARCRAAGVAVLADIHTHPRDWVGQSLSDRTHPMICTTGHFAFILPHFARASLPTFRGAGIYRYLGSFLWRQIPPESNEVVLI
jgi:hypothetical protein